MNLPKTELTNMDTNEKIEQYIVTIPQIVEIVSYCSKMTIAGSNRQKDWTGNVETAIDGINGVGYCTPKIKLTKASNLIHQAEIRAELRGVENTMDAWNDNGNGGLLQWASDEYNRLSALEKESE